MSARDRTAREGMTEVSTEIQTSDQGAKVPGRRMSFVESMHGLPRWMHGLPRWQHLEDDKRPHLLPDDSETTASAESWRSTLIGKNGTTSDRLIGAAA
jgi:hypothetical protein